MLNELCTIYYKNNVDIQRKFTGMFIRASIYIVDHFLGGNESFC